MSFILDKQTVRDLNLLGKYDSKSVFRIFDCSVTRGGRKLLEEMFLNPLSDIDAINAQSRRFATFMESPARFPFEAEEIHNAEDYLSMPARGGKLLNFLKLLGKKSMLYISGDRIIEKMGNDILALLDIFARLDEFARVYASCVPAYKSDSQEISMLLSGNCLGDIFELRHRKTLSFARIARAHYVLTAKCAVEAAKLMRIIYRLDVDLAVAKAAKERNFHIARALDPSEAKAAFVGKRIFHPAILGAKGNDLSLDSSTNMLFLTGTNMAGKSTFMKSVGIAIYLAHMGFPVPAESLDFVVLDGLFTSINVSDDLTKGYSHYYAEVMRVKSVALQVAAGHTLFVILDELFKGTNVSDALDATSAVIRALSAHRNCFFIVSTHILEAADALKGLDNVKYAFLPTELHNGVPHYTYRLTEGISEDRQGMMLIQKERIIERIKG